MVQQNDENKIQPVKQVDANKNLNNFML